MSRTRSASCWLRARGPARYRRKPRPGQTQPSLALSQLDSQQPMWSIPHPQALQPLLVPLWAPFAPILLSPKSDKRTGTWASAHTKLVSSHTGAGQQDSADNPPCPKWALDPMEVLNHQGRQSRKLPQSTVPSAPALLLTRVRCEGRGACGALSGSGRRSRHAGGCAPGLRLHLGRGVRHRASLLPVHCGKRGRGGLRACRDHWVAFTGQRLLGGTGSCSHSSTQETYDQLRLGTHPSQILWLKVQ